MRKPLLVLLFLPILSSPVKADYTYVAHADQGVRAGNPCNFDCTLSWGPNDTPIASVVVDVFKPDGYSFTPSYSYTVTPSLKQVTINGQFTSNMAGQHQIRFRAFSATGDMVFLTTKNVTILNRYP